ncbi:hypothetical protein KC350_g46 [Hortaea werneckii]|nr:hypothetical protein KC350_g46 [Hortaea werneckii]
MAIFRLFMKTPAQPSRTETMVSAIPAHYRRGRKSACLRAADMDVVEVAQVQLVDDAVVSVFDGFDDFALAVASSIPSLMPSRKSRGAIVISVVGAESVCVFGVTIDVAVAMTGAGSSLLRSNLTDMILLSTSSMRFCPMRLVFSLKT